MNKDISSTLRYSQSIPVKYLWNKINLLLKVPQSKNHGSSWV
jgi:hypothetical protein